MKKILLIATLFLGTANAAVIATGDVRFPFISNGGFSGACERLGWNWGYDTALLGGMGSYACYSDKYIQTNRIDTFITAD